MCSSALVDVVYRFYCAFLCVVIVLMMTSGTPHSDGRNGDCKPTARVPLCDRRTLKEQYDVTEEFGFASESPLTELPEYFKPWNDIAFNLQQLMEQKRVRNEVEKLPLLDHNRLESKAEWEAAHMFLAYITQGYVWQDGDDGIPEVLPEAVAVPYYAISERIGIPPTMNYFNAVLVNWKRKDEEKRLSGPEDLETVLTLGAGSEEQWFFNATLMVEVECGPALYAIVDAQQAVVDQEDTTLEEALIVIERAVIKMVKQLKRMRDGLTPDTFFHVIRQIISGWDSPAFRAKGLTGLIYEGVSDEPLSWKGNSGIANSILPTLDAALGITHRPSDEVLLGEFTEYMPGKHATFISAVARGPSIREYVESLPGSNIQVIYNKCLKAVQLFRDVHLQMVTRYIIIPASKHVQKKEKDTTGTGGTDFMVLLKGLRDSTIKAQFSKRITTESNRTSPQSTGHVVILATVVVCAVATFLYRKLSWFI